MFVGCAALTQCPKQMLLRRVAAEDALEPSTPPLDYRSPFRNWHERAAVRQSPRRTLREDETGRHYFPPELVPITQHPLVRELSEAVQEEILVQHLYRYLDFTAKLESLVVNRTVLSIAQGSVGVELPDEMRFDAYKIYCDEAYHTLFSVDLARQVERRTGIAPRLPRQPFFLDRLHRLLDERSAADGVLTELLFVVVSETLISASLAEVPDSSEVVAAVSGTVRDHAGDEGRHHAYFAMFLRRMWGQLSPAERRAVARLVPRLIAMFLHPDLPAIREELIGYGLGVDDAHRVVAETYRPEILSQHLAAMSQQTVRYFESLGAFDDARALEELHAYGIRN